MASPIIIVTGANGQLASEIKLVAAEHPAFDFRFLSKEELPISDAMRVTELFVKLRPAFCINCAAYTAVDKAETDKDAAMEINGQGPALLSMICKQFKTWFIHISTDYVFDGKATRPYRETDTTIPVNYYGETKLAGEQAAIRANPATIIIRTSWVYAPAGNNFVKTMIRLMNERSTINVVNDQFGSPTYAADLARAIMHIIERITADKKNWTGGIYHYSNEGIISWYDFAVAIRGAIQSSCEVKAIPTEAYPTPARRPAYSALNKEKIKTDWGLQIPDWKDSLHAAVRRILNP